jgi:hypothetical protein
VPQPLRGWAQKDVAAFPSPASRKMLRFFTSCQQRVRCATFGVLLRDGFFGPTFGAAMRLCLAAAGGGRGGRGRKKARG